MKKTIIPLIFFLLIVVSVQAVCTVTLDKTNYVVGETATAQMSCGSGNEKNQAYTLKWYDQTLTNFVNTTGTTPSTANTPFFDSVIIPSITSGSANLTGTNLEGDASFTVSLLSTTDLIIQNISLSTQYLIGKTGCVRFTTMLNSTRTNDAQCSVSVTDNIGGAPIQATNQEKRTYDGLIQFCQEVSSDALFENTDYVFEISCFKERSNFVFSGASTTIAFNTSKWLQTNTITDKTSYTLQDEQLSVCVNITNEQTYRIPLQIDYSFRCDGNNSDTNRVIIDSKKENRGISPNTTQNQCALLNIINVKTAQNKKNSCYASTDVNVLDVKGKILYTYSTTSPNFNFTSNSSNIKNEEDTMLGIILSYIFIIIIFIFIGYKQKTMFSKIIPLGMSLLYLLSLSFLVYANYEGGDLSGILLTNFMGLLIIGGFFGILAIWNYSRRIIDPSSDPEKEKWEGDDKWL